MDLDFIPIFFVRFYKQHSVEVCLCRCIDARDIVDVYFSILDIERIFNIKIDNYDKSDVLIDDETKMLYITKYTLEESEYSTQLNEFLEWCSKVFDGCYETILEKILDDNKAVHQRMKSLRSADAVGNKSFIIFDEDSAEENVETISEELLEKITGDDKISFKDLTECKTEADVAKKINENKIKSTKKLEKTLLKMDTELPVMLIAIYDGQTVVISKDCLDSYKVDEFYFKAEDVAKALNMKDDIYEVISEFEEHSEFEVHTLNGKYQVKEIIFLKYRGLMRLMYEKQIPDMNEFIDWIDDIIEKETNTNTFK